MKFNNFNWWSHSIKARNLWNCGEKRNLCLMSMPGSSFYDIILFRFYSLSTSNVTFAHVYSCCLRIYIYSAPVWCINWKLILIETWLCFLNILKCHIPRNILKSSLTHICLLYFFREVCAGRSQAHCQSRQADPSVDSNHMNLPDFGPALDFNFETKSRLHSYKIKILNKSNFVARTWKCSAHFPDHITSQYINLSLCNLSTVT